jgi:hypothetical protein
MNVDSIGAVEALLSSITTMKDGSLKISFEINPSEVQVINKLMELYLINERLFTLSVARSVESKELSNG